MKTLNVSCGILLGFALLLLLSTRVGNTAHGGTPMDDLAIKGYDTVAYFKDSKARKGSGSFTFKWHDMTWHFANKENRDLFAAAPEKYAPQYNGYCAWALTEARKAITDPEVWKIVDGKLYLNCSKAAYDKWIVDIPGHIKKADENWLKVFGGK